MLTEKQIQGIKNVRAAIRYHEKAIALFQNNLDYTPELQKHKVQAQRLQWVLEQIFTQEELDSVKVEA